MSSVLDWCDLAWMLLLMAVLGGASLWFFDRAGQHEDDDERR
jgi:hypothetical protein